jgi:hypothetical protein
MKRSALALVGVALALGGCLPVLEIKSRTRVSADGTTSRETVITKTRRNANSDDEKLWNGRPIVDDLPRSLGDGFRSIQRSELEIRMTGTFAHPEQMPSDFLRDVELLDAPARNRVDFVVEDLLFAKRYVYRERYVDAIQPEDLKENKRDAVRFAQKFAHAMIAGEFGRAFDTQELDRFIDGAGADLVGDLIEIYWFERKQLSKQDPVTRQTGLDRALARALKRIERVGATFDAKDGEDDNREVLEAWLRDLFSSNLKRKVDGSRPTLSDFDYFFPKDAPWSGLETMIARAAQAEYGTTEKAEDVARRVLLGITGTFGSPPAQAEFHFDCAVELPGQLLRTNGYLETERSAFWVFEGEDLFPQGQWLEAESFTPDDRFLGKIRELRPDVERRDAARLIGVLEGVSTDDRERMAALLAIAAQHGSLSAIPPAAEGDGQGQSDRKRLEEIVDVLRRE